MKSALIFSALCSLASAACPNACSGHGTCGQYDSCTCYDNWLGADCSQRQCMSGYSWITTSQGDINFDGDTNDATIHSPDARFSESSVAYVADQHSPGGTWEKWPSFFNKGTKDENHFYMECSNRGLCDRDTGECQCFEGYTGEACRRTVCPEDCSGHGRCLTVGQQKGSFTYALWDKDMSRSCACDAGFSGPACSEMLCPKGDDPITTDQQRETQWVDIYSDDVKAVKTDGPFLGDVRFKYTDYYGEEWITDRVSVTSRTFGMAAMATAVETALEGLPNGALQDVTVSAGHCGSVIPKLLTIGDAAALSVTDGGAAMSVAADLTALGDQDIVQCPGATHTTPMAHFTGDKWRASTDIEGTTDLTVGAGTALTCNHISHSQCVRLKITFTSTPGDLTDLVVDTSELKILNDDTSVDETTNQGATTISHGVTDTLDLVTADGTMGAGWSWSYAAPGIKKTCAADGCKISTDDGATLFEVVLDADGAQFAGNERIQINCGNKDIGTYTVSTATASTATKVTLQQAAPACAGTTGNEVKISLVTPYIEVNADLTAAVAIGDRISFATADDVNPSSAVTYVHWNQNSAGDVGRVHFTSPLVVTSTGLDSTGLTARTTMISHYGKGTSESSTCSDRGVCDVETGDCKCFSGYTGLACQHQNALAA